MSYTIGIDIGGTFTDCVVVDERGHVTIAKASSTPPDFESGVLDAAAGAAAQLGMPLGDLLADSLLLHGCTVGTNALVEGRTARVGLLVSAGHAETFFVMQSGHRNKELPPDYLAAVSRHYKAPPLVHPTRVGEVHERIAFDGNVLAELNEAQVRAEVTRLVDAGAEAFAVALLWSVVNDVHEKAVRRIIQEVAPGAFVSISSEVVSRVGEYERTTAAVVNSLVGPVMTAYVDALESRLTEAGYRGRLGIMSCWGGLIDARSATRLPILTIGSGPAAGVVAAQALSNQHETDDDVITADMGGTTFDVGLVIDGSAVMRTSANIGQYEYAVPTLDVRSVGAGGGSIVRFDEPSGTLRVGPESAGARPGPAAFMRGGTQATVTDADIVLGYLNPDYFLGGTMQLSVDDAYAALERAGAPLGFTAEQTAAAAARIVDNQMADAIRLMTVNQGRDVRHMSLFAFGGNGSVHASALARALGVKRVVVPMGPLASGWSAFGVASSDAVVLEEIGHSMVEPFDPYVLNEIWTNLEQRALQALTLQGVDPESAELSRLVEMKYSSQVHTVTVKVDWTSSDEKAIQAMIEAFEVEYARRYGEGTGFPIAGYTVRSVAVRAAARLVDATKRDYAALGAGSPPLKGSRGVIWYEQGLDRLDTPVYDGDAMSPGLSVDGPAIVEFAVTTLVLRPGQRASVDYMGNVNIEIKEN